MFYRELLKTLIGYKSVIQIKTNNKVKIQSPSKNATHTFKLKLL